VSTAPRSRVGIVNLADESGNPYLDSLVTALGELGVDASPVRLSPGEVVRARRSGLTAFHVHWPEYLIWRQPGLVGLARQGVRVGKLVAAIAMLRAARIRLVWTVHNLGPHDRTAGWIERFPYQVISRTADAFVAHSRDAATRAAAVYPRLAGRTIVAPHGNYDGAYPPAGPGAAEVWRARYGIPTGAPCLLAFGQVRAYKRLAELAALVAELEGVHLVIAGKPLDDAHVAAMRSVADRCDRIHLDLRRIPDEEVAPLYAAADLAILHYSEVFSSGALLLALTQGVAALSPRSAAAAEVAGPPALELYEGDDLQPALDRALAVAPEVRRAAALAASAHATWERAARQHLVAYGLSDS
jgi:beta-1,4-mannosyltransferase